MLRSQVQASSLQTTHSGSIGINIWNNKSLFMHIPTRKIIEETDMIDLTDANTFQGSSQLAIQDEFAGP